MRKPSIRMFFQWTLGTIIVCYTLLIFALDSSDVQGRLAQEIEAQLEQRIHSDVHIGRVEIGLFNNVSIHDLIIKDREGRSLLESKLLFVKLEILPLLFRQISIRNIALLDAHIRLYKKTERGRTNFQYILEVFKGDEEKESSLNLRINSLIMRRCELSYDEWYKSHPFVDRFSSAHISLSEIDANVSLKHLTNDSVDLRVRDLQAKEACGLFLKKLRMKIAANRNHCTIKDFVLETSNSKIKQEHLLAEFVATDFPTLVRTLTLTGHLDKALLASEDLAPFIPSLKGIKEKIKVSAHYKIAPAQIAVRDLKIDNLTNTLQLRSAVTLLRNRRAIVRIAAKLDKLQLENALIQKIYPLFNKQQAPDWLSKIGNVSLQGSADFYLNNRLLFDGKINSELGVLTAELNYQNRKLKGTVASADFNPSVLLKHQQIPEQVDFILKGTVAFPRQKRIEAETRLDIHKIVVGGKVFHDLSATLNLKERSADAELDFKDSAMDLKATAFTELSQSWTPSRLNMEMRVNRLSPDRIGLTSRWGDGVFAFHARAAVEHLRLKDLKAHLEVNDFMLYGDGGDLLPYHLNRFELSSSSHANGTQIRLNSDFADLSVQGFSDDKELKAKIQNLLSKLIRQLEDSSLIASSPLLLKPTSSSPLSFALLIKRTDFLKRVMKLDVEAQDVINLDGRISGNGTMIQLSGYASDIKIGDIKLNNVSLVARNQEEGFRLLAKAGKSFKEADFKVEAGVKTTNGKLNAYLQWKESKEQHFYGIIETNTTIHFPKLGRREKAEFSTELQPTNICINDSLWNVEAGRIVYGNERLNISNFSISHADQKLSVAGSYGKGGDGIVVDLKKIDVGYALAMTGLDVVTFGGRATGRGILRPGSDGSIQMATYLDIPHFRFNDTFLGHSEIQGSFDGRDQTIHLDARMKEAEIGNTDVKGYVSLGRKTLDLHVKSNNTPVAFLNKYVDELFHDIRGRTTGHCRVFGSFKAIDFEGQERASASAKVPVTGVTYHLNEAEIKITPGEFEVTQAELSDSLSGNGTVRGYLRHRNLRDMSYSFSMQGNRIKLYDRPYELDMPFYATAFGSGIVSISGSPGRMDANILVNTEEGSVLTYILDTPEEADQQLVAFREASEIPNGSHQRITSQPSNKTEEYNDASKTDIKLNLEVKVQPSSRLNMITDIKSGDVITVHGSGPIRATYYNKGDFQMFGVYNVQHGNYDMSIQNLIKKNFHLLPGGVINFSGDPLNADVNVKASYLVNSASLADLNIGNGFSNNSTPVNCLVHFTGKVNNMNLELDFDLPNVGEDEKRMVRSMMASEEDRTMQVLYLLGVGRFFTYNYEATETSARQSQSSIMMKSLLSSTLSSQINNIISNAVGASNWTFGANVATGQLGWSDMEVDGSLSGRLLNNRLLVNGKVGYHERQAATTNFVGDFDVHYLLTPSGSINLKAYSETNDRYFSKSSLSTQGVGIQLKRDFTSLRDFFTPKRKITSRPQQQKK